MGMIDAVDFRRGTVFMDGGTLYEVLAYQQHRMSQSQSMCYTKLKDLRSGNVFERNYRATDKFKKLDVERRPKTFLYFDGDEGHFMDMSSYEQMSFSKKKIGPSARFLTENLEVEALYAGDELLAIELPASVALKVVEAPPGIKGDSATNPSKPVTLENGSVVQCPVFIKVGDTVKVDTDTGEYVGRV